MVSVAVSKFSLITLAVRCFAEALLGLLYIAIYLLARDQIPVLNDFVAYQIFFLGAWLLRSYGAFFFSEYFLLVVCFYYDIYYGGLYGFYTAMVFFYIFCLRARIYEFVMDHVNEHYFFIVYLSILYVISLLLQLLISCTQSVLQFITFRVLMFQPTL